MQASSTSRFPAWTSAWKNSHFCTESAQTWWELVLPKPHPNKDLLIDRVIFSSCWDPILGYCLFHLICVEWDFALSARHEPLARRPMVHPELSTTERCRPLLKGLSGKASRVQAPSMKWGRCCLLQPQVSPCVDNVVACVYVV